MFRSAQNFRTFLTVLVTYILDLIGYSIVFPVLAPLLLNEQLHFFSPDASQALRTTVLGLLFSVFGITQFIGAPFAGVLADHYGRYKIFLATIGISVFGYVILAMSIYSQSLLWLFIGRLVTGFCSGNVGLVLSATADLTDSHHRTKAFGIVNGIGGLAFVIGPWIGGKLGDPNWLFGSAAFVFAAIASLINFFMILFFFKETRVMKEHKSDLFSAFKDLSYVFHHRTMRTILITSLFFCIGWAFFIIFSPTFLVQKFALDAEKIGDIFAYMGLSWAFASMYLNKELTGKFSLRSLIIAGMLVASAGVAVFAYPDHLWPYWIMIPIAMIGGASSWVNLSSILSMRAPENMQGRVMGANSSTWSIGQIIAPLLAGPLAGWNLYSPILVGAAIIFLGFIYFAFRYRET